MRISFVTASLAARCDIRDTRATHQGADGRLIPSRYAHQEELEALLEMLRDAGTRRSEERRVGKEC